MSGRKWPKRTLASRGQQEDSLSSIALAAPTALPSALRPPQLKWTAPTSTPFLPESPESRVEAMGKRLNGGCFGLGIWVYWGAEVGGVLGGVRDFILVGSSPIELGNPSSGVGLGDCGAFDRGTYRCFFVSQACNFGQNHGPYLSHLSSTIYHLSSMIHHLSSIIYHLPSMIHHLPSKIYDLWSIIHHLPSTIYHPSSFIFHLSSII
jgi:hypothetical protein